MGILGQRFGRASSFVALSASLAAASSSGAAAAVLSFGVGQTRANNGMLQLATDGSGTITVANNSPGTVHVIVDVVGFFQ